MRSQKYNFKFQCYPNAIEEERRRRGWTQRELARRSGITSNAIGAMEILNFGGRPSKSPSGKTTDTTAEAIAAALEVAPEYLFEHYAKAKAECVPRVKIFESVEERNAAIEQAMKPVRWTALKYCNILKCKDIYLDQEEIIATAYETLVKVAEDVLERGIKAGTVFEAYVCGAVQKEFLRIRKHHGMQCRKADLVSYEAYFRLYDPASSYRFEDHLELREECREAVRALSPERRQEPQIASLMQYVAL